MSGSGVPNRLLNAKQVAESLAVSISAVYVLVERGELSGYKLGRRLRFEQSDIEKFLGQRRLNGMAS